MYVISAPIPAGYLPLRGYTCQCVPRLGGDNRVLQDRAGTTPSLGGSAGGRRHLRSGCGPQQNFQIQSIWNPVGEERFLLYSALFAVVAFLIFFLRRAALLPCIAAAMLFDAAVLTGVQPVWPCSFSRLPVTALASPCSASYASTLRGAVGRCRWMCSPWSPAPASGASSFRWLPSLRGTQLQSTG